MQKEWEDVKLFHQKFNHPTSDKPKLLDQDRCEKRVKWMLEEVQEFVEAKNLVDQADAMVDLMYFALGTLVEIGVNPTKIFNIVHEANMSKLWKDGKPHYNDDGKTIKPKGWVDPYPKILEEIEAQKFKSIKIVVAKKEYCIPAVLEMVLNIYDIKSLNQDDIASQFTINSSQNTPEEEWGIVLDNNSINNFFERNDIPLVENFISINQIYDEYDFVDRVKKELLNSVIICGYNYSYLYGNKDRNFSHVSIILDISDDCKSVYILDPGPKESGFKWVDLYDLYLAIKNRKDGLWCISKK